MMKFKVKRAGVPAEIIEINQSDVWIGRGSTNHLQLRDSKISRQHLRVIREGKEFFVEDLGSANGTLYQGQKIPNNQKVPLNPLSTLLIGNNTQITLLPESPPLSPLPPPSLPSPLKETNESSTQIYNKEKFGPQGYKNLYKFFNSSLKGRLHILEEQRKKALVFCIFAALFGFPVLLRLQIGIEIPLPYVIVLFILAVPLAIKAFLTYRNYRKVFKEKIVREIFSLIDENWQYHPEECINSSIYNQSGLFRTSFDIYKGDDFVSGKIEKTDFEFSEIHTQYTSTDSKGNKSYHTIFQGIFLHADFNKNIHGKTYVFPDTAESFFGAFMGKFLQSLNGKISPHLGEIVHLEDAEFEKKFAVYSTDQVEARYILTPKIMQALLKIKKELKNEIQLSFKENRIFLAVSFSHRLFEPRFWSHGVRFEDIKRIFELFGLAALLIEELELNKRIWSKQ